MDAQLVPSLLARMSRSTHDSDAILELGSRAASISTASAAAILLAESGTIHLAALHDGDPIRRTTLAGALESMPLSGADSPFQGALDSGHNAILGIASLTFSTARPRWADQFDRLGIAALGITPLIAGDRTLGLLVSARLTSDEPLGTAELARQAQVAMHLTTALDTSAALAQMRRSTLVVDSMRDAVIGFSRDREVILWNSGAVRMYGIPESQALGRRVDDLVANEYPPDQAGAASPAISLINTGSWTGRVRQRTPHGRVLHAEVSIASVVVEGQLGGAVSIARDVTLLVEAEAARAEHEQRMQALLDASQAMTAVFDRNGTIMAVNTAWSAQVHLGGVPAHEVGVGADYVTTLRRAAGDSADARAIADGVEAVLAERVASFECDYDIVDEQGTARAYMVSVAPMPGGQGGAYAAHTDITARKRMERQLAHEATRDPLTGLRTRRVIEHEFEAVLRQAEAQGSHVGAIVVDLDRFKDVNDTLGHEAGDQVLVAMARRLVGFQPASAVGRLAGDEFVLIVPEVRDRAELARLAGDLARVITAPLPLEDRELYFGVSIGTALSADTEPGADAAARLLRAADTAMYRAKDRGRNSIVAYDEGLRADVGRRVQISAWLHRAVERGELAVEYQPQFRCLDGRQVGVEALIRWHHPEAGDISPTEFVAIAEESGAIRPIGAWVLARACEQAAAWAPQAGPEFSMAVNLSPHQLIDPGLLDLVRSTLLHARLPATCLTLEVTEGALIEDPAAATQALARLRALGVRISLDDFGTGYSSLAYLAKFPVDELKVDRVFVRDIEHDPRTRALAEGIVRIGHALGMRVLAEGVETPGQLRILTGAGCDFYQGFLAAPAEPAEQAAQRLRRSATGQDIPAQASRAAGRTISLQ